MSLGFRDVPMSAHSRRANDAADRPEFRREETSTDADPYGQKLVSTFPEASSSATIWRLWERKKGSLFILAEKEIGGEDVGAQLQEKVGT